jgi:hypothetical protein
MFGKHWYNLITPVSGSLIQLIHYQTRGQIRLNFCDKFHCPHSLTHTHSHSLTLTHTHSHSLTHTHSLTPYSTVLLDKLTGLQLVKKFNVFYGTWRFITAFAGARQLSLSWASPDQSISPQPTSWIPILILSSILRLSLPRGLFPLRFPTAVLYRPLLSPNVINP